MTIAGPSEKDKDLVAKVANGEELTWEDLSSSKWSVMSSSSSTCNIYPYLWFQNNYEKGLTYLPSFVQTHSYPSPIARLASGQIDIIVCFTDVKMDNAEKWQNEFGKANSFLDETNVIGVADKIYKSTVSNNSEIITDEFKKALQDSFIEIGESEEGKNHRNLQPRSYKLAKDKKYDGERET
ncbi:PhnD/SsuA/transferrin family substrate-binding protein [Peptoniphilus rhinitidis]|uniref:PhnD/SsuA/transferrin family substrate-binding protein n=1 Tax=Peptoniphilus rhinitidis TaxID=1175452 RepID=UPI0028FF1B7C|nr:PhnD/SsuA/transferrin family substrate-binding protein [Peptoniphilus rhinitidis]MDU1043213.1 PhnD/SsuA/transferrin family substrate-binding protein [Peptoniphilus rhinitidis]